MWRRLQSNISGRAGDVQVSTPLLIDTTLDETEYSEDKILDAGQRVGTFRGPKHGERPHHPPRQPRTILPLKLSTQLYGATYQNLDQQQRNAKQTRRRPASSLYSQPSPTSGSLDKRFIPIRPAPKIYDLSEDEVSPLSSPEIASPTKMRKFHIPGLRSAEVSPVDDMEPPPVSKWSTNQLKQKRADSCIPTPRREARRNQAAATAAALLAKKNAGGVSTSRQSSDPRWDPFTGETTTDTAGRPSQVRPAEYKLPADRAATPGTTTTVTGGRRQASFGDRIRKLNETKKGTEVIDERPEWKGASGRETIVPPVLSTGIRQSRKVDNDPLRSDGTLLQNAALAAEPAGVGLSNTRPAGEEARPVKHDDVPKAQERLHDSPTRYDESPSGLGLGFSSDEDRDMTSGNYTILPPRQDPPFTDTSSPSSTSQIERNFQTHMNGIRKPLLTAPVEVSHFSAATSVASAASTPRPSIDQALPVPQLIKLPLPLLTRRRPRNDSIDSLKATTRKPMTSPTAGASYAGSRMSTSTRASIFKDLPKPPPELASKDRISTLQARNDDLTRRRLNLEKSIHQMTELMPQDGVTGREKERRGEEKRRVEALKQDLSDVKQEEHDVGLRLHRAYKREAENAAFEPTSLWVRRVTG